MISQTPQDVNHPLYTSWNTHKLMLTGSRKGKLYRLRYFLCGKVGSLFDFESGSPKNLQLIDPCDDEDTLYKVYDNLLGEWTHLYLKEIPFTRTYAPRPHNTLQEIDYFVRSAALVCHKFIWSNNCKQGISMDDFASIKNENNLLNRGRFSLIEGLPHIKDLIRPNEYVPQQLDFTFPHTPRV